MCLDYYRGAVVCPCLPIMVNTSPAFPLSPKYDSFLSINQLGSHKSIHMTNEPKYLNSRDRCLYIFFIKYCGSFLRFHQFTEMPTGK